MWRFFIFATVFVSTAPAQNAPSTDIFLVELGSPPRVQNVTGRPDYDNQPHFLPGYTAFLYTSQRSGQTDIYRFDLRRRRSSRLTRTPESEYSATPLPGGQRFSVIRVEGDGRQRLWSFKMDGMDPELLLPELAPVGYQAWPSATQVVTFILGSPATLQLAELGSPEARILARNIGRCLRLMPNQEAVSFVSKAEAPWMIRKWSPSNGSIENVAPVLEGSEDYAWSTDGQLFMGRESTLYRYSSSEHEWTVLVDLSSRGVAGITRLDVSGDGRRFLVVAGSNARSREG